jgi:hypothetical protein
MYMTIALILFGVLSFAIAYIWERRIRGFNELSDSFRSKFNANSVDISGRVKYTSCMSHKWVMKNIVHGDYSNGERSLSDYIGENTLTGTILVGCLMGAFPVLLVFVLFQSFVIAGASLVTIIAAVFLVWSPGEVGVSYNLLSYLNELDSSELEQGDFAYAKISTNRIKHWERTLLIIGVAAIAIAPWGELIPDAVAFAISGFITFLLTQLFLPIASFSFPLALVLFICAAPITFAGLYFLGKWVGNRMRIRKEKFLL